MYGDSFDDEKEINNDYVFFSAQKKLVLKKTVYNQ